LSITLFIAEKPDVAQSIANAILYLHFKRFTLAEAYSDAYSSHINEYAVQLQEWEATWKG